MAPPTVDGNSDNSKKSGRSKKKGEDIYVSTARTIARCVDLWCNVDKVITTMRLLQQDEASRYGDLDEDNTAREVREECLHKISPESREYATRTYYKIIHIIPGLKEIIDDPTKSVELSNICSKMNSDIRGTRSSDATHLKASIPRYCLPNPSDPTSLNPPILNSKGRAEMGLNHPILARWLCPADQLKVFDDNPERARKDLASGVMPMEGEDFPSFFWSGALPGQDFDPTNMVHGLFKSYFLVRVARHIFLGPSFAVAPPDRKNRSCNAILNDVTTIEPEHIAYVCIQARFGISSKDQWNEMDGDLNYFEMYRGIIRFIRDPIDTEWRDGLLRWWNKEIFGNENGRDSSEKKKTMNKDGNSVPRMSTMERLRAQMEARLAAPPELSSSELVLDPSLLSTSSATSVPLIQPEAVASTSSLQRPSALPAVTIFTPSRPVPATAAPESPLSEEEASMPLTPVTNHRGKQAKSAKANSTASGKRPAPLDEELPVDGTAIGGRSKKSKRSRK